MFVQKFVPFERRFHSKLDKLFCWSNLVTTRKLLEQIFLQLLTNILNDFLERFLESRMNSMKEAITVQTETIKIIYKTKLLINASIISSSFLS